MSILLEKAIEQLRSLPESEQDRLGRSLLDELRWEQPLPSEERGKLANLAAEALEEYRAGRTRPMKP